MYSLREIAPKIDGTIYDCRQVRGLLEFGINKWAVRRVDIEVSERTMRFLTDTDRGVIRIFVKELQSRTPVDFVLGPDAGVIPVQPLQDLSIWQAEFPYFEGVVKGIRNYSMVAASICSTILLIINESIRIREEERLKGTIVTA